MSPQPIAKSWQAENPDERLVPPRPRKELMKRCSDGKLLTSGILGPSRCWRSPGVSNRQNRIAEGESVVQPQMGFCHSATWTLLLSETGHLCLSFASQSAVSIWHITQIDKGLARGSVPFIKIKFDWLRTPWQRGGGRPIHGTFLESRVPALIILWRVVLHC